MARDFWDGKVTTQGGMGGTSYALSISMSDSGADADGSQNNTKQSIAGAFKVAAGVSFAAQWGRQDNDMGADTDGYGVKLGYDAGSTGIGVLYRRSDNGDGTEPATWGIGIQHAIAEAGLSVLVGYYRYDPDDGMDETGTFTIGSRLTFN